MSKKETKQIASDFNLQQIDTEQYSAALKFAIASNTSLACFGRRGSGKTHIAKETISNLGYHEIYMNLSVMERTDLAGFPDLMNPKGDYVNYRLPASFKPMFEGDKKVVLLLDEVDKADPSLWASLLELVQFHTLNGRKMPNLLTTIMTGNLISEGGNKPCLPLLDRSSKFLISPDSSQWLDWAGKTRKIHPSVTAFINDNRNDLFGDVDPDNSYADPSPRGWENASKILKTADELGIDPETTYKMVAGCVGNAVGIKYRAYFDHYQKILPLVNQLFEGKNIVDQVLKLHPTEQLVASMIVCSRLATYIDEGVKPGTNGKKVRTKETDDALTNAAVLLTKISHEYCLISVRSQLQINRIINGNLDSHVEFKKVLTRVKDKVHGR